MIQNLCEETVRIILAEDHKLVRNGVKLLLNEAPNIEVIAEMDNGREALDFMRKKEIPDVIITDLNMPKMDGWELIEKISIEFPAVRIIALSILDNCEAIKKTFNMGGHGYLLKNIGVYELIFAVYYVHKGGKYLCEELSMKFLDKANQITHDPFFRKKLLKEKDIGKREIEVLQLISEGYTNAEIADKIFLSKRTVEGHRQNLIQKVGVKNTASLIRFAAVHGLVS